MPATTLKYKDGTSKTFFLDCSFGCNRVTFLMSNSPNASHGTGYNPHLFKMRHCYDNQGKEWSGWRFVTFIKRQEKIKSLRKKGYRLVEWEELPHGYYQVETAKDDRY